MGTSQTYTQVNGEKRFYNDTSRTDKRRAKGKKKGWQVAEMWDRHHEIARLLVLGWDNTQIAKELNISAQQVSNVRNSPVVQDKIAVLHATRDIATTEIKEEINALAPIAVQRLREALEEGKVLGKELNPQTIVKVADSIIDRDQGRAVQRVDARNATVHFTREDIEDIKERARKIGMESEQIVNL